MANLPYQRTKYIRSNSFVLHINFNFSMSITQSCALQVSLLFRNLNYYPAALLFNKNFPFIQPRACHLRRSDLKAPPRESRSLNSSLWFSCGGSSRRVSASTGCPTFRGSTRFRERWRSLVVRRPTTTTTTTATTTSPTTIRKHSSGSDGRKRQTPADGTISRGSGRSRDNAVASTSCAPSASGVGGVGVVVVLSSSTLISSHAHFVNYFRTSRTRSTPPRGQTTLTARTSLVAGHGTSG